MADPTPYILFPGTAREALTFYGEVFGCTVQLHTFAEFNRADGPADAIAHGYPAKGPVALSGADVSGDELPFRSEGMMLALLGTAAPKTLRNWFSRLAESGRVVDDLQVRPWGARAQAAAVRHLVLERGHHPDDRGPAPGLPPAGRLERPGPAPARRPCSAHRWT